MASHNEILERRRRAAAAGMVRRRNEAAEKPQSQIVLERLQARVYELEQQWWTTYYADETAAQRAAREARDAAIRALAIETNQQRNEADAQRRRSRIQD